MNGVVVGAHKIRTKSFVFPLGVIFRTCGTVLFIVFVANAQPTRVVPAHSAPSAALSIPDQPTEEDIKHVRLFAEPLQAANGNPSLDENRQLGAVLARYSQRAVPDDFSDLEQFVGTHPDSPWTPSLLFNLGLEYSRTGWYSKALGALERAWPLLKPSEEPAVKALADRAVGELALMYARVGRMTELSDLLDSIKGRVLVGPGRGKVASARQGLWTMQHNPEIAFRCGPMALDRIIAFDNGHQGGQLLIQNSSSTTNGLSLSQVAALSDKAGLHYQMAFRTPGAPLLLPAVVNWKVGHYAALIREKDGLYLSQDPTFHHDSWVTARALDNEATGYFLVASGNLPSGWRSVSAAEGRTVWGKGTTENSDPNDNTPWDKQSCDGSDGTGMAVCSVYLLDVSLNIRDKPVGYTPPFGPSVRLIVNYNQLESDQPANFNYSNLGAQWTFNFLSYITDDPSSPDADVNYYTSGGGSLPFTGFNENSQSFDSQMKSHVILTRTSPTSYQMHNADGSGYVFSLPDSAGTNGRNVFMTEIVDPQGNVAKISYDASFRVVGITDAIGQVTTLSYENGTDPLKITKVTDPFGRFASFSYDASNRLSQITDCIGLKSQFTYDTGDNITAMTTPYGTTSFAFGQDGRDTWLETTYPDGEKERAEYTESTAVGTDSQDPASTLPQGMWTRDWVMYARNTYFWDKNAYNSYAANTNDYTTAYTYHWLHDPTLTTAMGVLESEKPALESRIWYNYAGQPPGNYYATIIGSSDQPSVKGRVLDDGSTQLSQFSYNDLGYVTHSVDPIGRSMTYVYADNLVDLLQVYQTTGANNVLLTNIQYNATHLPIAVYDAAGQLTTNTYNARGQLLSTTDAIGETTSLSYDSNGYLLSVTGPLRTTNDVTSYTYDSVGRVHTCTLTDGYTVTCGYDNMDRMTNVVYPDGTSEIFTYDKLDQVIIQDRLGRQTRYTYDALRRKVAMQDPLNRITRFEYCGCGSLAAIIDPMGRETLWRHDIEGRLTSKQYPDGSQVTYTYENSTKRLKSVADEQGQLKIYTYYQDDDVQSISYANEAVATAPITFTYDPNYDRMVSMQDATGSTEWTYNPPGSFGGLRLSTSTGPWANAEVIYQYDALSRATNRIINGVAQTCAFDPLGRAITLSNILGTFSYGYDGATARLSDILFPNGQSTHYTYFNALGDHRLQQITNEKPNASVLSSYAYAYNSVGDVTNWVQQLSSQNQTWNLSYDAADQLLAVKESGANALNYDYGYDTGANRLLENTNSVQRAFNYNSLNQVLSSSAGSATNTIYQWDAEHRLAAIIQGNNQIQYWYDGFGRRLRIVQSSGGITQADRRFVWCGAEPCEEWNSNNVVVNRYFSEGEQQSGTNLYYARDHLGSVRELTDGTGAIRAEYGYAPYGAPTKLQGDLAANYLFAGEFAQPGSGLMLAVARAYDPVNARWISRDPIEEQGGVNLYDYAGNNPISGRDPLGTDTGGVGYGPTIPLSPSKLCSTEQNYMNGLNSKPWYQQTDVGRALNPWDEGGTGADTDLKNNPQNYSYQLPGSANANNYTSDEVNYIGIGMYEAWMGDSIVTAIAIDVAWSVINYQQLPSMGKIQWTIQGYNDYQDMQYGDGSPACSCQGQ